VSKEWEIYYLGKTSEMGLGEENKATERQMKISLKSGEVSEK